MMKSASYQPGSELADLLADLQAQTDRADELAAEVARRKTDAGAFQRMYAELYERACDLEEENAALRAQLAAGEGWRTLDEPWEGRNKVQFLITDGWFNDVGAPAWAGGALIKLADAGRWVRYRPAPPPE